MPLKAQVWLAKHHNISTQDIHNILKDEKATSYLLAWSVFEQEIFEGYMKLSKIKTVAKKFEGYCSQLNIETIAKKFHNRYQDKTKYSHLVHDQDFDCFRKSIEKTYINMTELDKLAMLFFVVYRYRNNIFHGNKKVLAWTQYTEQIEDCLTFMTQIIDLNQKEKIIKKKQENNYATNNRNN